ncbi:hypothetical protein [Catellatospora sichuanensis]|uniref:hypothetical protein n=1 Tax=Catellatospora sichuanensis TaxID=1969805 RepID=UPI0011837C0B|nr:hypothetical protein [Catellatospora sichuanensis]
MKKPEDILKAAEAQGLKVKKVLHGWMLYPVDASKRPQWVSRNSEARALQNSVAAARKAGVII